MSYDIIGDIHGHARTLAALLEKLGYAPEGGTWHHPRRKVIFLGDFIDRGPHQRETLEIEENQGQTTIFRSRTRTGSILNFLKLCDQQELAGIAWLLNTMPRKRFSPATPLKLVERELRGGLILIAIDS